MYKTAIVADYFIADEIIKKTGLPKDQWLSVIPKELIDNALDAIEPLSEKSVYITSKDNAFKVFDNGNGLSIDDVKQIYDFENYVSKNRHIITASRGKQGNGLKTIIGICYVQKYTLLWHTNEGIVLKPLINADLVQDGTLEISFEEIGKTEYKGIEIADYPLYDEENFLSYIKAYQKSNSDVNFHLACNSDEYLLQARSDPIDKSNNTSISFYDYNNYRRLLHVQNPDITYKAFLEKYFGTRVKNTSLIKSKIKDLDYKSMEFIEDFKKLKLQQKNKPYTLLKKHLIGFSRTLGTTIQVKQDESEQDNLLLDTFIPCIMELEVTKLNEKQESTIIDCYINNSLTYNNGRSVAFKYGCYDVGKRKCQYSYNLSTLLDKYSDYYFQFHFISPYLRFMDAGKTEIDISSFINDLVPELSKALTKETNEYNATYIKPPSRKTIAEKYMSEAFMLASTNGKYSITARQMYYKLRELAGKDGFKESTSTYNQFTQDWLTRWLDEHDEYEEKVNFSDRGNFFINGTQTGLGTANVRSFISTSDDTLNKFILYGGFQNDIYIKPDFGLKYKYDKALYIEKTGFDAVFKAEHIDKKYNLIIISGQGFASRAARNLLYHLQQQGLKLYCLHDLDISGVSIYNSMQEANTKFKHDFELTNLGITIDNVAEYQISPELIDKSDKDRKILYTLDNVYQEFFNHGNQFQRVELNAFSTEQILSIIENRLNNIHNLPNIRLQSSLELDQKILREVAFMQVLKDKYQSRLDGIHIPCNLEKYDGNYTVDEAQKAIPMIRNELIEQYKKEIIKNIAI